MRIDRSGWQTVTFGDVVQEISVHEREPERHGIDRYVGLEHLDAGTLKVQRWGLLSEGVTFTKAFRAGQVLFGKRRVYQKKAGVPDFDSLCSGDIIVLAPKDDRLLSEFLPLVVQSDAFFAHAEKTSSGSLSPRTKFRELAKFTFLLPPPEQQRELVELLHGMEAAIEAGMECLAALQVVKDQDMRQQLNSPAGDQEGWQQGSLGDFITLQRGHDITMRQAQEGNVPIISSSGITGYHNQSMASGPGVIIGRKGSLGKVHYIEQDYWPHDTTLWVKDFKGNSPKFIGVLLKFLRLEQFDAATACPTLNRNVVHKILVQIPPVDIQEQLVRRWGVFDEALQHAEQHLNHLRTLRAAILNTALSPAATTAPAPALVPA